MAAVLLSAGTPGKRFALPNARIVIHQPWGGVSGQAADIDIQAREVIRLRTTLNGILGITTGRSAEQIAQDADRDFIMDAEKARAYGIIDQVMEKRD